MPWLLARVLPQEHQHSGGEAPRQAMPRSCNGRALSGGTETALLAFTYVWCIDTRVAPRARAHVCARGLVSHARALDPCVAAVAWEPGRLVAAERVRCTCTVMRSDAALLLCASTAVRTGTLPCAGTLLCASALLRPSTAVRKYCCAQVLLCASAAVRK